jgi:hypothetical protein
VLIGWCALTCTILLTFPTTQIQCVKSLTFVAHEPTSGLYAAARAGQSDQTSILARFK